MCLLSPRHLFLQLLFDPPVSTSSIFLAIPNVVVVASGTAAAVSPTVAALFVSVLGDLAQLKLAVTTVVTNLLAMHWLWFKKSPCVASPLMCLLTAKLSTCSRNATVSSSFLISDSG